MAIGESPYPRAPGLCPDARRRGDRERMERRIGRTRKEIRRDEEERRMEGAIGKYRDKLCPLTKFWLCHSVRTS